MPHYQKVVRFLFFVFVRDERKNYYETNNKKTNCVSNFYCAFNRAKYDSYCTNATRRKTNAGIYVAGVPNCRDVWHKVCCVALPCIWIYSTVFRRSVWLGIVTRSTYSVYVT